MEEMTIGTKVRITFDNGTMTDKDYEIVSIIPWSQELNDWCGHYIVRDNEGNEKEIREYECVYSPKDTDDEEERIHEFLEDNGVWAEVYRYSTNVPAIVVSISWGDWKHEHGWSRNLMSFLGYHEIGCRVTEENGSDCYSAEHYFLRTI